MTFEFHIKAPSSTANFGPGFDCLSASIDIENSVRVILEDVDEDYVVTHTIRNSDDELIPLPITTDLTVSGISETLALLGHPLQLEHPVPSVLISRFREELNYLGKRVDASNFRGCVSVHTKANIPFSRGCGSSTAAYQAGVLAALAVLTKDVALLMDERGYLLPPVQNFIAHLCIIKEGHPDNAIACAYGGCQISLPDQICTQSGLGKPCYNIEINSRLCANLLIPESKTSTSEARLVLPDEYPRSCCILQLKCVLALMEALKSGDVALLKAAFDGDQFHVPFRAKLNPHLVLLHEYIKDHDITSLAATLSGSGSTILVVSDSFESFDCLSDFVSSLGDGFSTRLVEVRIGGKGIGFSDGC
eukprot:GHVH01003793.1.p1 GENE.GHVH01003793.1~~GHVH01003793.1.p1  ORF type:complete len:362 (+),score=45.42 GHVH01003793.1:33-1118(+)